MKRRIANVLMRGYSSEVTGSCIESEVHFKDGSKFTFVVDYGFYQGNQHKNLEYNTQVPIENIGAVLITHSHLDHIGAIPCLVRNGYHGKIFMSNGCKIVSELVYNDTFNIMKREKKEKHKEMLFFKEDIAKAMLQSIGVNYEETFYIHPQIRVTFFNNAHLPGSSMILVTIVDTESSEDDINILFTGDYNNKNSIMDVKDLPYWLYATKNLTIITESTYGNTMSYDIDYCIEDELEQACEKNRVILLSAFAQGRYQQLLSIICHMEEEGRIPKDYPIKLDGPSAWEVTMRYLANERDLNIRKDLSLFPSNMQVVTDAATRNSIIAQKRRQIIISTSGMMSNGPCRAYIPSVLSNYNGRICVCGYASEGTLARSILDTEPEGDVAFGDKFLPLTKRCETMQTFELSAHACADKIIDFLNMFNTRSILITHGEPETKKAFKKMVSSETMVKESNIGIMGNNKVFKINKYGIDKCYTRI